MSIIQDLEKKAEKMAAEKLAFGGSVDLQDIQGLPRDYLGLEPAKKLPFLPGPTPQEGPDRLSPTLWNILKGKAGKQGIPLPDQSPELKVPGELRDIYETTRDKGWQKPVFYTRRIREFLNRSPETANALYKKFRGFLSNKYPDLMSKVPTLEEGPEQGQSELMKALPYVGGGALGALLLSRLIR